MTENKEYIEFPSEKIIKSQQDDREYKLITLKNELDVLLISDKETDISSASLSVNVGYLNDPDELPGLAHFCEHLLFMGTKKYPIENEYSEYLSSHGGGSNAYTSSELTNYYFYVDSKHLEGALDRFSQFFISPLFDDSCTERELNAINSENDKNVQSDEWRQEQLKKTLCREGHPLRKFGTGNLDTLKNIPMSKGINTREELLKFYNKYYSSNIMKLVIYGKESLDDLCNMAVKMFSDIKNIHVVPTVFPNETMTKNELNKEMYYKPVKDLRNIDLFFPFKDDVQYYLTKPGHYLSHLIGHESEGSIFYHLKEKGWAQALYAGNMKECKNVSFFSITVELTEQGYEHYKDVIIIIFQYFEMLKQQGSQKWIFDECKTLNDISFQFKEKSKPVRTALVLSKEMLFYPKEHIIAGMSLYFEYNKDLIEEFTNKLNADNFVLVVSSKYGNKDFKYEENEWKKEKYYGSEYSIHDIDSEFLNKLKNLELNPALHLPKVNPFVPKDFSVEKIEKEENPYPGLIIDNKNLRIWFKRDDIFFVPKLNIFFEIRSPISKSSPLNYMYTAMYLQLVKEALNKDSYHAEIADTKFNIKLSNEGNININVQGYSDVIGNLLGIIVNYFLDLNANEEEFTNVKDKFIRTLKNFSIENPYKQGLYYALYISNESVFSVDEKLEALKQITFNNLKNFIPLLLSQIYIEGLVHGNCDKETAKKLGSIFIDRIKPLPYPDSLIKDSIRSLYLKKGFHGIYKTKALNPNNINSSIQYSIQIGDINDQDIRVKSYIIRQLISEPCFDKLRTKEQLGYIVFSGLFTKPRNIELYIIVQSEYEPEYLEFKVEEFLNEFKVLIEKLDDDKFEKNKESVITKLLEKPKNLAIQTTTFIKNVESKNYDFGRDKRDSEYIKKITKSEILEFFNKYIDVKSPERKKLSIHIISKGKNDDLVKQKEKEIKDILDKNTIIDDVYNFRRSQVFGPSPISYKPIEEYLVN